MIKLIVSGACGKMGERIIANALTSKEFELVGAIERSGGPHIGLEVGIKVTDNLNDIIQKCDVIIDFTNPENTLTNLELAVKNKKAMVIGTTGFSETQLRKVKELGSQIPCVMAPNMSLGVNLLFKLAAESAKVLGDEYDVEIVEAHHRMKKDAPSGTAKKIAEVIAEEKGWDLKKVARYGREGLTGERKVDELGIRVIRGGDIVGEHTVLFNGPGETIQIKHTALSRDAFARGALVAARFVSNKKKGLYGMADVLA